MGLSKNAFQIKSSFWMSCGAKLLGLGACGVILALLLHGCGAAQPISTSDLITYGGSSTTGSSGPVASPRTLNLIYPIWGMQTLTAFDSRWSNAANLPFINTFINFGQTTTDRQTPGVFDLRSYDTTNFTFNKATVLVQTRRDTTDTEGIIVGGCMGGSCAGKDGTGQFQGVFSGLAFNGMQRGTCQTGSFSTTPQHTAYAAVQPSYVQGQFTTPNISSTTTQGGCVTTATPCSVATACASSPFINYDYSSTSTAPTKNLYYIDHSLDNYQQGQWNTFGLDVAALLAPSPYTAQGVIESKAMMLQLGDDSPIAAGVNGTSTPADPTGDPRGDAILLVNGFALSDTALSCTNSPNFAFTNYLVHKDGVSTGNAFFKPSMNVVDIGVNAQSAPGTYGGVQFYFSPEFPRANVDSGGLVDTSYVTLSSATLRLAVRKTAAVPSALVVNGVGVAQAGFDTSQGTSEVTWDTTPAVIAAWDAFVTALPGGMVGTAAFVNGGPTVDLDLVSIFGASTMKTLIAQGKLNFAIAGGISAAQAYTTMNGPFPVPGSTPTPITANRTYRIAINGPAFLMNGTYYTLNCTIPPPPSASSGAGTPPAISSVTVLDTQSTYITLSWATDEPAKSNVLYGAGAPTNPLGLSSSLATVHTRTITGLQPFRYYYFQAAATDADGNTTTAPAIQIRTLR